MRCFKSRYHSDLKLVGTFEKIAKGKFFEVSSYKVGFFEKFLMQDEKKFKVSKRNENFRFRWG